MMIVQSSLHANAVRCSSLCNFNTMDVQTQDDITANVLMCCFAVSCNDLPIPSLDGIVNIRANLKQATASLLVNLISKTSFTRPKYA